MNAFSPSRQEAASQGGFTQIDLCSLWRGQFIEEFASAEAAVSEALAQLSEIASSEGRTLLPHLVGARFEALRKVIGAKGPLAAVGSRAAAALEEFRDLHRYRTFVCHGTGAVTVDRSGKWRLTIHMTSFRGATVDRTVLEIAEDEAALILARVSQARLRLDGQLKGMLASLSR